MSAAQLESRAEIRRRVKSGEITPWQLMDAPASAHVDVKSFLLALPGMGGARADEIVRACRADALTVLGEMHAMQHARLVEEVARFVD